MKFSNEKAMIRNIKYMRTMVTAKCFTNGLTTDQKLKAKNQLKEYQKIVYDVIATEKNPNYKTNLNKQNILGENLENQCVWIEMDKDKTILTELEKLSMSFGIDTSFMCFYHALFQCIISLSMQKWARFSHYNE